MLRYEILYLYGVSIKRGLTLIALLTLLITHLCFCPPDKATPLSPTTVLYPLGNFRIKLSALASLAASYTYWKVSNETRTINIRSSSVHIIVDHIVV